MDVDPRLGGAEPTPGIADVPLDPTHFDGAQTPAGTSPAQVASGTAPSTSQVQGVFNQSTPPLADDTAFGLEVFFNKSAPPMADDTAFGLEGFNM